MVSTMKDSGPKQIEWDGGRSVERVLSNGKRRFTPAFKAWVIGQCLRPGMSLAGTALANGLNANLVRKWVANRKAAAPVGASLLPVRIVPAQPAAAAAHESGFIEVEIHGARIKLHGSIDTERLRAVLAALA